MQTIVTIATLALLLASLLIVNRARKEANEERSSARAEAAQIRDEVKDLFSESQQREQRVALGERQLVEDQRNAQKYARGLEERVDAVARDEKRLVAHRAQLEAEYEDAIAAAAGLTVEEAKASLTAHLKANVEASIAREAHLAAKKAKVESERRAREVLIEAMQRETASSSAQAAVTRIELPSDEMKGRIIGREGRNIRALEALTGVNIIVDEGVNAVHLSSFDVERREIAAVTLSALIEDGRIQPHRIESAYAKAVADGPRRATEAGLDAAEQAGVGSVPPSLLELVGALRLRTSYGQNVLAHLIECATLASSIATLVGADVDLARRAAFLHDIGKAMTGTHEGTHAQLGARAALEAGETADVVNAIAAHHDEVPQNTLEAVIVQIADALSASRPGARKEDADSYVERMAAIEELVMDHEGVAQVYAMAAGRELRVVVEPAKVTDAGTVDLAQTIAEQIEKDFGFGGEIRVTVIRETRADFVAGQA